jgi:hypothetical protein
MPNYAVKDTPRLDKVETAEIIKAKTAERPTLFALRLKDKDEKVAAVKAKLAKLEKARKDKADAAARLATPKPTFIRKRVTAPTPASSPTSTSTPTSSPSPTSTITQPVERVVEPLEEGECCSSDDE